MLLHRGNIEDEVDLYTVFSLPAFTSTGESWRSRLLRPGQSEFSFKKASTSAKAMVRRPN